MSKENKSAGPFDLNRDGKLSMTEYYIAYKTFEEMSKPSSYIPRPRKEKRWNKPVDFGCLGNVIYSFIILVVIQAPFVVSQIGLFEQLQRELEIGRYFLRKYGYSHVDVSSGYIAIAFVALIQLALFCVTTYGCVDSIKKYCRSRQERKERKQQAEKYPEE